VAEGRTLRAPPATRDARQVRSHNALAGALLELLDEQPFDQITIRQITARAGTGYATFFRHFTDKEALLGAIATAQITELFGLVFPVLFAADSLEATRALCRYVDEHRALWRALLTGGAAGIVRREFVREAREWASRGEPLAAGTPAGIPRDLAVVHGAGSTIDLLAWWLGHPEALSADQFAAVLDRLVITPLVGTQSMRRGNG
jgi:AcrR family transcriptional regulator